MPKHPAPHHPSGTWCRWCGQGPLNFREGHKSAGKPDSRRGWHDGRAGEPDCFREYALHTRPRAQFAFLVERDGKKCIECGEAPERWLRCGEVSVWDLGWPREMPRPRYCQVRRVSALQVEHRIPLWLVAHLPPDERRPHFGPSNLALMCVDCHAEKTAREAADRAKGNRLIANANGTTKAKRKIASRGFDKSRTRGFDGKVRPR